MIVAEKVYRRGAAINGEEEGISGSKPVVKSAKRYLTSHAH